MTDLPQYYLRGFDGDGELIGEYDYPMGTLEDWLRFHVGERTVYNTSSQIREDVEKFVIEPDEGDEEFADEIKDKYLRAMVAIAEDFADSYAASDWRLMEMSPERVVFEENPDGEVPDWLTQDELKDRLGVNGHQANALMDAFRTWNALEDALEGDEDLTEYDGIGATTAEQVREQEVTA